jgi:hypothetical protein
MSERAMIQIDEHGRRVNECVRALCEATRALLECELAYKAHYSLAQARRGSARGYRRYVASDPWMDDGTGHDRKQALFPIGKPSCYGRG